MDRPSIKTSNKINKRQSISSGEKPSSGLRNQTWVLDKINVSHIDIQSNRIMMYLKPNILYMKIES